MTSVEVHDSFSLKTNSDEFTARISSVFDGLSNLEKDHEDWKRNQDSMQDARLWKAEPGEEASFTDNATVFKKPLGFSVKRKFPTTDFKHFERNPSKWTKYSLANVPELSERSNARAALSFLEDRKRQKLDLSDVTSHDGCTEKIVFQKPQQNTIVDSVTKTTSLDTETKEKASNSGTGKFVMPECVVGAKKIRKTNSGNVKSSSRPSVIVHLDHLDDEENEINTAPSVEVVENPQEGLSCCSGIRKFSKKEPTYRKMEKNNTGDEEYCTMDVE